MPKTYGSGTLEFSQLKCYTNTSLKQNFMYINLVVLVAFRGKKLKYRLDTRVKFCDILWPL
jgi:hypothetical protein